MTLQDVETAERPNNAYKESVELYASCVSNLQVNKLNL